MHNISKRRARNERYHPQLRFFFLTLPPGYKTKRDATFLVLNLICHSRESGNPWNSSTQTGFPLLRE
jgi:hypothetical protein